MAELGAASGIVGIVAAAVQSARVLADFAIEVRDATADARAIAQDAQALSGMLTTLEEWLQKDVIKPAAAASLTAALITCLETTNQLCEIVQPYTKTARSRSHLTWRSIKYTLNKQEVRELRERWQQSKSTLNVSLAIINTYANTVIGAQIEAGNNALRQDFQDLQNHITKQKEYKIDVASITGRRGSQSNVTDVNFPLNRYLEQLPPEGHPWEGMSEIGDVLSLRSFSMLDIATRSSTPEADLDATVEMRTASSTLEEKVAKQESPDLHVSQPDLRLTTVSSEPTTRSEIRNLDAVLYPAKPQVETETARSKTLPLSGSENSVDESGLGRNDHQAPKAMKRAIGPLHQALIDGDTYSIISLLPTGIDVNELDADKRTPLHVCALWDDKAIAQTLLRTGRVNLSLRDIRDRTPLQCALEVENDGMACLLLQWGAMIEDVADFIVKMISKMRKPAEEKVAHACLAWLSKRNDFDMEDRFIDALVAGSRSSTGAVARFLEGTPFQEEYVQRSNIHTRSRSMDSRARTAGADFRASFARLGVGEHFGLNTAASGGKQHAGPSSLSPNLIIPNSILDRLSKRG